MPLTDFQSRRTKHTLYLTLLLTLCIGAPASAQDSARQTELQQRIEAREASGKKTEATVADLQKALDEQQKLIDRQNKQIERQQETLNKQQEQISTTADLLRSMQSQIDQLSNPTVAPDAPPATTPKAAVVAAPKAGADATETSIDDPAAAMEEDTAEDAQASVPQETQELALTPEEIELRSRLAKLESTAKQISDDPSSILADANFPGAIRVPGTTGAFKIGGYVKASGVKNFDKLATEDSFIVGSIAVTENDNEALASETNLSANQSRINFDYRQQQKAGNLRAYIEGDFADQDDDGNFRLRHAFGQFRDLLAGKTWSAFYDAQAAPEEVDFEGTNGRIILRQTQFRYFPQIGKDLRWMISLEDPQPQVTGGTGVSDLPDLVTSIRRDWFNRWHVKTALLLREVRSVANEGVNINGRECTPIDGTPPGTADATGCTAIGNAGSEEKDFGWGLTASGRVKVPIWGDNDTLLFQLNYGEGIGRYINDLSSINALGVDGGQDAVTDPETGDIRVLPVFSGYLAFQHWWNEQIRSTFLISGVVVDNDEAQSPDAYNKTSRASANIMWSPIPSVDVGAEILWGKRTNNDGQNNDAKQFQIEALYRF